MILQLSETQGCISLPGTSILIIKEIDMKKGAFFIFSLAMVALLLTPAAWAANEVKIGFNIPLTGDNPDVGGSSRNAAEMFLKSNSTINVGGKAYTLKFIYEDNEYKPESAVKINSKLITEEGVLGIVGPQSSSQAVPAGEVANNNATPMISPWSTNPNTTLDRPYVFRGCFLDPFQGPVAANFATEELGAKKAAVIYDIAADYPKGLAISKKPLKKFMDRVRLSLLNHLPPVTKIFPPR